MATAAMVSGTGDTRPGPHDLWTVERAAADGRWARAWLFVALERHRLTAGGRRVALHSLDEVVVGRGAGGRIERSGRAAVVLVGDSETSRRHFALRRTAAGWLMQDLGSRNGTFVNGEQVPSAVLCNGDLIEAGGAVLAFSTECDPSDDERDRDLEAAPRAPSVFHTLNCALEQRVDQVTRIAQSAVPVLIRGETGTGKELMARAIHDASGLPGAFVAVNCGALPRGLLESELFGHRRGAFSGATEDREGLVRHAHLGTLFLDEIAELPGESQVALLRVLQEGEVRPVGASEDVKVSVRVIAATHQDLALRIAEGRFRQDLYARIAGFEVVMPALRERREDLGTLIAMILPRLCDHPEEFSLQREAACAMLRYDWPQNIRELEQALRSAVALCEGGKLRLEHLPEAMSRTRSSDPALSTGDVALRDRLIVLLEQTGGNVAAVARAMSRAPVQIRRWCRRFQIDLARYRR